MIATKTRMSRYYAQHTDLDPLFKSIWRTGCQVFDREALSPQGEVLPICFCINQRAAFKIRDALNTQEDEKRDVQTKTDSTNRVIRGEAREVFTHEHFGTFDVTAMRARALRGDYELCQTALYPDIAHIISHLQKNRDVDYQRVWNLMIDPTAPWDTDPTIMIHFADGEYVLVDGIHRLMARWALRCPSFVFFAVPYDQAPHIDRSAYLDFDWGRLVLGEDGKFYDRNTGELVTDPLPNV